MKRKELLRSIKFLLFSISAGVIQALSFTLCQELLHCSATVSHLIALILSVLWNFTLNRRYTFQSASNIPKAMLLVALFYAVGRWNAWFNASIFLRSRSKYPLQLFLREILIANQTSGNDGVTSEDGMFYLEEVIKYCTIIVSTVPILCIYPFVQKYFVTGVMLGSVKG